MFINCAPPEIVINSNTSIPIGWTTAIDEYRHLITEASIPRHYNTPPAPSSCHWSYMKTFPPLFVYPLERERITHLVGLLSILGSCTIRIRVPLSSRWKMDWTDVDAKLDNSHAIYKGNLTLQNTRPHSSCTSSLDSLIPQTNHISEHTFGHHDKGTPIVSTSNRTDVIILLPLFHDPFL